MHIYKGLIEWEDKFDDEDNGPSSYSTVHETFHGLLDRLAVAAGGAPLVSLEIKRVKKD